jgi:amidophosphoribosyltransferase
MIHMFDEGYDKLSEECGIFGIFDQNGIDVHEITFLALYALQHRGQESAGIAISNEKGITYHKNSGLAAEVFDDKQLIRLQGGKAAIGHVRSTTSGDNQIADAQPLVTKFKKGTMALAHNGSLINAEVLRADLEERGAIFQTTLDIEVIANLLARSIDEGLEEALKKMISMVQGSYGLVIMTEKQLIAIRDPHGIRWIGSCFFCVEIFSIQY